MTALLSAESGDKDKIAQAVAECKRMDIQVLPPDVNESRDGFTIVEYQGRPAIRFGFSGVKNVGEAAIENISEARLGGKFLSLNDFLERTDSRKINKKVLESLIKVGAMSQFGNRATLLTAINDIKRIKRANNPNQNSLFAEADAQVGDNFEKYQKEEFSQEELEKHELELLGFSLSARSIVEVLGKNQAKADIFISEATDEIYEHTTQKIVGVVKHVKEVVTRKSGQKMAFVEIDDGTGSIETVVFPALYADCGAKLIDGSAVLISAKLDKRDDETSAVVEKIEFLDKNVTINLPANLSKDKLTALKELLKSHPGNVDVYIYLEANYETVQFPQKIAWSKGLETKVHEIIQ